MRAALVIAGLGALALAAAYQVQARYLKGSTGLELELPGMAELEDLVGLGPNAAEISMTLNEPNVLAFLATIRAAEGTAGANGYRTLFGGGLFNHFADHPRIKVTRQMRVNGVPTLITSTAAGAYQILERTWDDAQRALGLPDFSPAHQDIAGVWLIRRRGALDLVREGRFEEAISRCAREWASLPGSPYGQPVKTLDQVRNVYAMAGGGFA